MFKTKEIFKLPDAPKPPSHNMMKEDMMIADNDDYLFSLLSQNDEYDFGSVNGNKNENATKSPPCPATEDELFGLATRLSRTYNEINDDVQTLKEKGVCLEKLKECLRGSVDDVKKRALTAMSSS